jgi:nitroimidazol reductase NimA-like FMN-containing flavoprotein (pyridoxamine 5'-phosphate oxidase superfamily)
MIERMKAFLRERRTCVLATVGGEGPHCSLMSYAVSPDGTEIYLVTHRQTKKYRNLLKNSAVSLLIDAREDGTSSESTRALTVEGIFRKIENERTRLSIRKKFLEIHPLLKEFLDDPEAEIFTVRVVSLQLLDGIRDSSFFVLE